MTRFTVSVEARYDLAEIKAYLLRQAGRQVCTRIAGDLRDGIRRVARMPGIGHHRSDLTAADVRFFLVHRYFIVYVADPMPVQIVRILHSARDVSDILGRV